MPDWLSASFRPIRLGLLCALGVASCSPESPLSREPRTTAPTVASSADASADVPVARPGATTTTTATLAERVTPPSASAAPSASAPAAASARSAADSGARHFGGTTLDFDDDGSGIGGRERAHRGRVFVHDAVASMRGGSSADIAAPLVVFFHGLNRERIPFRWMGGGKEGDVRAIVAGLVERGAIEPAVLAAPSSTVPSAVSGGSSFPAFDLPRFVDRVEARLADVVRIDRRRVVVVGHSGAGCSERGGIVTALGLEPAPLGVVSIDTCMGGSLASSLASSPASTHVVVTWQTATWKRDFKHFRDIFSKTRASHPESSGTLRELDELPALPRAHDAAVAQTLERWLPRLLPSGGAIEPAAPVERR
jgi:hypothetical protein